MSNPYKTFVEKGDFKVWLKEISRREKAKEEEGQRQEMEWKKWLEDGGCPQARWEKESASSRPMLVAAKYQSCDYTRECREKHPEAYKPCAEEFGKIYKTL